jgi:hypothetical protein
MRSQHIIIALFTIFAGASIIIPSPMFPGNWFCNLFGDRIQNYTRLISAMFNGAFYSGIIGLIFFGLEKKLGEL